MKRNYWPLFFIGIFGFVFSMIVWTVKSAVSVPIIEDKSFMKKYQDVDEHYNDMMTSNAAFLSKYNFELMVNEKILIYVNSEHFAVETLMDGFEIMSEYLLKNVDPDKIIYINKK